MGSSQSIGVPSTFTHEKLFELTKEPRLIMNYLLDYMLKEVTVRDFLLLSNPEQCNKYVLFMTNSLSKFFYELKIEPIRDKKGVIAFRALKDITTPPTEQEKREKDSLCLILSYFYTRIFQIYGALALTLIDDVTVMSSSGLLSYMNEDKRRLLAPGYRPYSMIGGNLPDNIDIGYFSFLRSFLVPSTDLRTAGYYTKYPQTTASISFTIDKINNTVGIFYIGFTDSDKYAQFKIQAKQPPGKTDIEITLSSISYYKKGNSLQISEELPYSVIPKKQITILQNYSVMPIVYSIKDSDISINDFFIDVFNKLIPYIRSRINDATAATATSLNTDKTDKSKITTSSETGTEQQLRLSRIVTALTRDKPLGHCIARALQLLKTIPLKDQPGVSSICKAKFLEIPGANGVKLGRSGIPPKGESLDQSPGLSAMSQLFYDTIAIGTPKIQIGTHPGPKGQSSLQQYLVFMKNMATLFGDKYGDNKVLRSDQTYIDAGLKGIKNRRDKDLCDGMPENISLSPAVTKDVYTIISNMFKIQYEHAHECGKIFMMLFNINRDKSSGRLSITLSANIIKNGLPEIDRVNHIARDLLIKYYSECETRYLFGMKTVLDYHKHDTATKAAKAEAAKVNAAKAEAAKVNAARVEAAKVNAAKITGTRPLIAPGTRPLVAPGTRPLVAPGTRPLIAPGAQPTINAISKKP